MIYFVQCNGENGPIKIGWTRDAESFDIRMEALCTGNPYPLRVIGTIPKGTIEEEHQLHSRFASANLRGEWFNPIPDLKHYIRFNCLGGGAFNGSGRFFKPLASSDGSLNTDGKARTNGLCGCGCGNPAPIAVANSTKTGAVKGQPHKFIAGHFRRRKLNLTPFLFPSDQMSSIKQKFKAA